MRNQYILRQTGGRMSEKKNSISKTLVWILMGLLIFGLGGFGITNLGGAVQNVGSVDGKDISVDQYYRALQEELNALQAQTGQRVPFAQAQQFGVDQRVLARLLNTRALDAEAQRLGLSMGDENLREQVLSISAFQGLDGTFDREAYRFALQNSGLNETEFENSLREDAARNLLQGAVIAGVEMPSTYADTFIAYVGERRGFSIARLTEDNLDEAIAEPTDADLRSYYDANIDDFMRPATRDITYAWIIPSMLIDEVEVDADALRTEYEARTEEFNQPERRLVERLVFGTSDEATEALAQINAGDATFEKLVEARGLTLADVDMGDVTKPSLSDAGDLVFTAETGAVVGPHQTDLGPALFRVNAILAAQETTFEEAEPQLRDAIAADRARRVIDAQINDIDDLLAGGATLEELVEETDLQLGSIAYHTGLSEGIAGYQDFRRLAAQISTTDFPEIESLDDGGIFALRLDGETEAAPAPFDEIKEDVAARWRSTQVVAALTDKAEASVAEMQAGADIITLGLTVQQERDITRGDFVPEVPADFLETIFGMAQGDVVAVPADDTVLVVELDSIDDAETDTPEATALRNIVSQQATQALAQDIFDAYANTIRGGADIEIDQHALAAVHAQLP